MVKLLKTLITYKLKQPKPSQNNGGFTLIELLVGLILSLLVILPLLGFMVNLLQTDRQEQAKASSEQEIQSALSYISRDLEQAVYIYDGAGVEQIKAGLPTPANSVPVLVFWKRQFVPDVIPTGGSKNDDGFTYALVAYYLQTTPKAECNATNTWSCTAQIRRLLVRGEVMGRDGKSIPNNDEANADEGFKLFNPATDSASLEDIMNAWTPDGTITKVPEFLIDYIDQTDLPATPVCDPIKQQVPTPTSSVKSYGFYTCVDVDNTSAQVFIRGNALARLRKKTEPPTYAESKSAYFPRASIQVKGRGLFSTQKAE